MALTPIAPFRPRRWRGAVLKSGTEVRFRVLDPYKRPVSATADSHEVRDVVQVTIREAEERTVTLLFDPEHNLERSEEHTSEVQSLMRISYAVFCLTKKTHKNK